MMTFRNLIPLLSLLMVAAAPIEVVQAQTPSKTDRSIDDAAALGQDPPVEAVPDSLEVAQEEVDDYFEEVVDPDPAAAEMDADDLEEVVEEEVVEEETTDPGLSANEAYNQGVEQYNNADYEAAIASFNYALDRNPDFPDAYMYRGLTYAAQDKVQMALEDLDRAIALDPQDATGYFMRGTVYFDQGDLARPRMTSTAPWS
jgi:tetratricopeptide (TPR) repeat protein